MHLLTYMSDAFFRESLLFFLFLIGVIPFLLVDSLAGGLIAFLTHSLLVWAFSQKVKSVRVVTVYSRKGKRLVQKPRSLVPVVESVPRSDDPREEETAAENLLPTLGSRPSRLGDSHADQERESTCSQLSRGLTPQLELTPSVRL